MSDQQARIPFSHQPVRPGSPVLVIDLVCLSLSLGLLVLLGPAVRAEYDNHEYGSAIFLGLLALVNSGQLVYGISVVLARMSRS